MTLKPGAPEKASTSPQDAAERLNAALDRFDAALANDGVPDLAAPLAELQVAARLVLKER